MHMNFKRNLCLRLCPKNKQSLHGVVLVRSSFKPAILRFPEKKRLGEVKIKLVPTATDRKCSLSGFLMASSLSLNDICHVVCVQVGYAFQRHCKFRKLCSLN